jgi:hypothetical protein
MKSRYLNPILILLATSTVFLISSCAGTYTPPPPLWDSNLYNTVAVLPVRMTVATGRPPFTTEDTELSGEMGGKMQEALSIVMRYKNYEVLSPDDLSERLMKEDDLADAFVNLAASQGLMGPERTAPQEEGMAGAALIAEKLGADLLIVAHGRGEYHSVSENLFQGIVTGLLSKGKEQYNAPPSYLEIDVNFIDPASGYRIARFPGRRMGYENEIIPLSRMLDRVLRRVPKKPDPEDTIPEDPGGTDGSGY